MIPWAVAVWLAVCMEPSTPHISPGDSASQVGGTNSAVSSHSSRLVPTALSVAGSQIAPGASISSHSSGAVAPQGHFNCRKCGLVKPLNQLCKAVPETCLLDAASYKALSDRWLKQPKLKTWWKKKDAAGQMDWYRRQQSLTTGTKRRFDEVLYEEETKREVKDNDVEDDFFMTWKVFRRMELSAGGRIADIEAEWKRLVESSDSEAEWRRSQWCIPEFQGFHRLKEDGTVTSSGSKRRKAVESAEQMAELNASGDKMLEQTLSVLKGAVCAPVLDMPHVDTSELEQPTTVKVQPPLQGLMQREVMTRVKDDAIRANLAAQDEMEAALICPSSNGGGGGERGRSSIALHRLKLMGVIDVNLQKVPEKAESAVGLFEQARKEIEPLGDDSVVSELGEELTIAMALAKDHWDKVKKTMVSQRAQAEKAATVDELNDVKIAHKETLKGLTGGASKDFFAKVKIARATVEKIKREVAASTANPSASASQPAIITTILALSDEMGLPSIGATGSLFEAKAGLKPSTLSPKAIAGDVVALTQAVPYFKHSLKLLAANVKQNQWGCVDLADKAKFKKVEKALQKAYDPQLFSTLALPAPNVHPWASKIFTPQTFGASPNFVSVGVPHMAMMDARMLTSGSEYALGFKYENVPGSTFKEKRVYLLSCPAESLSGLIAADGWAVFHDTSKILLVPTGFIVMYATVSGTEGIRWSVASDSGDLERVKQMLVLFMEGFPQMKQPSLGYQPFHQFLIID